MTPYDQLGLKPTATLAEAKAAYRRLAQQHHPDRGGSEARFKEIKAAWEAIEAGWQPPVQTSPRPPVRSSFGAPPAPVFSSVRPAPGYRPVGKLPVIPRGVRVRHGEYSVDITITENQAFMGCTVEFECDRQQYQHTIWPGARSHTATCVFPRSDMIGSRPGDNITVHITLKVIK